MPEPDVGIGFIYGWRQFDVAVDGHLMSPYKRTFWPVDPTPKAAVCKRGPYSPSLVGIPHTVVPDVRCGCGYYCYSAPEYLAWWGTDEADYWIRPGKALALCRVWGGIVLHTNGFRSQYLAIDELWMNANQYERSLTRNLYQTFRVRNLENFLERKGSLQKKTTYNTLKDIVWIPSIEADLAHYDGPRSSRVPKTRTKGTRKNLKPGSSQKKIAPREQDPKTKWWW